MTPANLEHLETFSDLRSSEVSGLQDGVKRLRLSHRPIKPGGFSPMRNAATARLSALSIHLFLRP
jgi:hypothetical protein